MIHLTTSSEGDDDDKKKWNSTNNIKEDVTKFSKSVEVRPTDDKPSNVEIISLNSGPHSIQSPSRGSATPGPETADEQTSQDLSQDENQGPVEIQTADESFEDESNDGDDDESEGYAGEKEAQIQNPESGLGDALTAEDPPRVAIPESTSPGQNGMDLGLENGQNPSSNADGGVKAVCCSPTAPLMESAASETLERIHVGQNNGPENDCNIAFQLSPKVPRVDAQSAPLKVSNSQEEIIPPAQPHQTALEEAVVLDTTKETADNAPSDNAFRDQMNSNVDNQLDVSGRSTTPQSAPSNDLASARVVPDVSQEVSAPDNTTPVKVSASEGSCAPPVDTTHGVPASENVFQLFSPSMTAEGTKTKSRKVDESGNKTSEAVRKETASKKTENTGKKKSILKNSGQNLKNTGQNREVGKSGESGKSKERSAENERRKGDTAQKVADTVDMSRELPTVTESEPRRSSAEKEVQQTSHEKVAESASVAGGSRDPRKLAAANAAKQLGTKPVLSTSAGQINVEYVCLIPNCPKMSTKKNYLIHLKG